MHAIQWEDKCEGEAKPAVVTQLTWRTLGCQSRNPCKGLRKCVLRCTAGAGEDSQLRPCNGGRWCRRGLGPRCSRCLADTGLTAATEAKKWGRTVWARVAARGWKLVTRMGLAVDWKAAVVMCEVGQDTEQPRRPAVSLGCRGLVRQHQRCHQWLHLRHRSWTSHCTGSSACPRRPC